MKRISEGIIAYLIVMSMLVSSMGLFSVHGTGELTERGDRDGEVTINNITMIPIPDDHGVYYNGMFPVPVNFTLAQELMNVNVTLNITHDGDFEVNTTERGNLSAGDYEYAFESRNFTDPGLYDLYARVEGWLNGTGMVNDTMDLLSVNFTSNIWYQVDFTLTGAEHDGKYARDPNVPLLINCSVTNVGNVILGETNVSISITNVSDDSPETLEEDPWELVPEDLHPGSVEDYIIFSWIPSVEGPDSEYTINVTATNTTTGRGNTTLLNVEVENVVELHVTKLESRGGVEQDEIFNATVYVNNTGNIMTTGNIQLEIYESGTPANVVWGPETMVSFPIPAESGAGTGRNGYGVPHLFEDLNVTDTGSFIIKAAIAGTAEHMENGLVVNPKGNTPPFLLSTTVVIEPDPRTDPATVEEGTELTFSINYTDMDGDNGTVNLTIDDELHTMDLASWSLGDNDEMMSTFEFTWSAVRGNHTYTFEVDDERGALGTYNVSGDFMILAPTHGWVKGHIVDDLGANVTGAEIDLFTTVLNETGASVKDQPVDVDATDAGGAYSKYLPFSSNKYILSVNETWMTENNYTGADPTVENFVLIESNMLVWKNFTLYRVDIPDPTTLSGKVNDTDGNNLSEVEITIEIFEDVAGNKNRTEQGVEIILNITTRTWYNLTATTDANGNYSIIGVPLVSPFDNDTKTGSKIYVHGEDELPTAATEDWWKVTAAKAGYEENSTALRFTEDQLTVWNVVLTSKEVLYQITGKITTSDGEALPDDTAITFAGGELDSFNRTTGLFSFIEVANGDYELTVKATGYFDTTVNVAVNGTDWDVGTIIILLKGNGDPINNTEYIGPFTWNGEPVPGIVISFQIDGTDYSRLTEANGTAIFNNLDDPIPLGTEITATGKNVEKWNWGDEPPYDDKVEPPEEDINGNGGKTDNTALIIIIVVVVFIILILIVVVIKSRGAARDEYHDEDLREYECPGCGAVVSSDMTECPECGEAFEEEEFRCPECGEMVEMDAVICDACGSEFEMPAPEAVDEEEAEELEDELPVAPDEPEAIDDFDVVDAEEEEDLLGIEEAADELEEEDVGSLDDIEDEELEDL